jgi:hypothetical protein
MKTHGLSKTAEYVTWRNMLARCYDPKGIRFARYGGRGIKVCKRWRKFENFLADVGPKPSPEHSLDRFPDRDGNYEPSNVRWATRFEQMNNTSRNHWLTVGTVTRTLAEWERATGVGQLTIRWRVEHGCTPDEAIKSVTQPTHCYRGHKLANAYAYHGRRDCRICRAERTSRYKARVREARTHCSKGHAYTPENVYLTASGCRGCRTCKSEASRAHWVKV